MRTFLIPLALACSACGPGDPCGPDGHTLCTREADLDGAWTGATGTGNLVVNGTSRSASTRWVRGAALRGEDHWLDSLPDSADRAAALEELTFGLEGSVTPDGAGLRVDVAGTSNESFTCLPARAGETSCVLRYRVELRGAVGSRVLTGRVFQVRTTRAWWLVNGEEDAWSADVSFTRDVPVAEPPACPLCEGVDAGSP